MKTMNSLPQPFVTIYIGPTPDLAIQDKPERPLLLKDKDNNDRGTVETQIASLTIINPCYPKFLTHKNMICCHSPFFAAAFNGKFAEGTTQSMTLNVDEEAFGVLANWFYIQAVVSKSGRRPVFGTLARVWIMAEQFMMPILQNQIMDVIHGSFASSSWSPNSFIEFARVAHNHGDRDNQLVEIVVRVLRWCNEAKFNYYVDWLPQKVSDDISSHSLLTQLVSIAALLRRYSPSTQVTQSRSCSRSQVVNHNLLAIRFCCQKLSTLHEYI
jgi:hypothetical protein